MHTVWICAEILYQTVVFRLTVRLQAAAIVSLQMCEQISEILYVFAGMPESEQILTTYDGVRALYEFRNSAGARRI